MYYLGVDIGGTATKACLIDESARIRSSKEIPTAGHNLNELLDTLTTLIVDFQSSFPVKSVGIGVAGLLSSKANSIVVSPNIPCLVEVRLGALVADRLNIPVVIENDANAAAWAEFNAGAGRGTRHMLCITLGTGLGGAIILDGRLYRGASGFAGELGHTAIDPGGRTCACGRRGCLETIVSGSGIVVTAREMMERAPDSSLHKGQEPLTAAKVFDAAVGGDVTAMKVFEETGRWLGTACANLINLFNPDRIVVGGGVMGAGETLLRPARDEARRRAFPAAAADCEIVQFQLWPHAGAIGAAMLARDQ